MWSVRSFQDPSAEAKAKEGIRISCAGENRAVLLCEQAIILEAANPGTIVEFRCEVTAGFIIVPKNFSSS